jgi:hypothetical protein
MNESERTEEADDAKKSEGNAWSNVTWGSFTWGAEQPKDPDENAPKND